MKDPRTILLIGTFDTKGEEYAYVRQTILDRGHQVLTMDVGILASEDPPFPVHVSASDVARATTLTNSSTIDIQQAAGVITLSQPISGIGSSVTHASSTS